MCREASKVADEKLEKVSGGAIWMPHCANCNKLVRGGIGIIRIHKEGAEHPYFCTECAEKFLNSGEATIDQGYEDHYQRYIKSENKETGEIIYGWRKIKV